MFCKEPSRAHTHSFIHCSFHGLHQHLPGQHTLYLCESICQTVTTNCVFMGWLSFPHWQKEWIWLSTVNCSVHGTYFCSDYRQCNSSAHSGIFKKLQKWLGRDTPITFDLAAAKKAYAITWENNQEFGNIIIRIGAFYHECPWRESQMQWVWKKNLIESGICASGSIQKVMMESTTAAIHVHKIVLETLERLLLESFESSHPDCSSEEAKAKLIHLAEDPCEERLRLVTEDHCCQNMLPLLSDFKERVCKGAQGKLAQFQIIYKDWIWLMLQFQRATKENNWWDLHLESLEDMCRMFFAYDHQNYSRYTALCLLTIRNLHSSHPRAEELLRQKEISVNRSDVPTSRSAIDTTIELTINHHTKSHGALLLSAKTMQHITDCASQGMPETAITRLP